MKQKITLFLLMALCPLVASAYDTCINGIYYNVVKKAKQATVTYGDNQDGTYSGVVVIPETIVYEGITCKVVGIEAWAFSKSSLTKLSIPSSITKIEKDALMGLSVNELYITDLKSWCNIDFPHYGSNPLSCSSHLYVNNILTTAITIPNDVTAIKDYAFIEAKMLKSVTFSNNSNLESIGKSAFGECTSLESINIPNKVTSIGEAAFKECSALESINIPDKIETIRGKTFYNCKNLQSVTMGSGIKKVQLAAFGKCENLQNVYISDLKAFCGIQFENPGISQGAVWFEDHTDYTQCPLVYAKHLFLNGNELSDIVVPDGVENLDGQLFSEFEGITSLTIPDCVEYFNNSYRRFGIVSSGRCVLGGLCLCPNLKRVSIGAKLVGIRIVECENLTTVEIGNNSGTVSVEGCDNFSNLNIGSCSELTISYCNGFESLNIQRVTSVELKSCDELATLVVGKAVQNLKVTSCEELADVYCAKINFNSVSFSADCQVEYATLHVPQTSLEVCRTTAPWSSFGTIVALVNGDPGYENGQDEDIAFSHNSIREICLANWDLNHDGYFTRQEAAAVTDIGTVFKGNTQITSFDELQYFTGLSTIANEAFKECTNLQSITIPTSVTSIGNDAFNSCEKLQNITIPSNLTSIGDRAFYFCPNLQTVPLHDGITSIGSYAFAACYGITSLVFPKKITIIPEGMYAYCYGIKRIEIPNYITEIGEKAFSNGTQTRQLTYEQVTIPNSVKRIGVCAFSNTIVKKLILGTGLTEFDRTIDVYPALSFVSTIEEVYVPNINVWYQISFGSSLSPSYRLYINGSEMKNLEIPQGITSITDYHFAGCTSLTSAVIPSTVTEIGKEAFKDCTGLLSLVLPKELQIGIPSDVGSACFVGCTNLKDIYYPRPNPTWLSSSTYSPFYGLTSTVTLHVPATDVNAYKENWDGFTNIVALKEGDPGYENSPNDIISFEDENVRDVCIMNWDTNKDGYFTKQEAAAVTDIGEAFKDALTYKFDELRFFTSLKSIPDKAFFNHYSMTNVTLPNSITSIGEYAFRNTSIASIILPEGVKTIGNDALSGTLLTTIEIPASVTTLGSGVCDDCQQLKTVYFHARVNKIEIQFHGCSSLKDFYCTSPEFIRVGNQLTFEGASLSNATLHVPASLLEQYKNAYVWKNFGSIIALKEGDPGYEAPLDDVTLTVNNYTRVYGDDNPTFEFTVSDGTITSGTPTITCSATKASPVGTYDIVIAKGTVSNSTVELVKGTLTITKAPLTISAGNYTKVESEDNPTFTPTFSGFKNNETKSVLTKQPTITTTATKTSPVGSYPVTVTGAEAQNYEISYQNGTLTVQQKAVLTARSYTRQYGDENPAFGYTVTGGTIDSGTPTITCSATKTSPVGTYDIVIAKGTVSNSTVELVKGTLTITKAPLTISAGNYTKEEGEANPTFTPTFSGFKNNETKSVLTKQPTITTTATTTSAAGSYPVTVSGAEAENYEISYQNGTLIVTEVDVVVVSANDYIRVYGEDNPTFDYTVSGGTIESGTPIVTCSATKTSPVGTYDIVIAKGTVSNRSVELVKGTLTITKAPLMVTAGTYKRKQGEENPEFTLTYEGFKNNETAAVLTKPVVASCEATATSEPGEYEVTLSDGEAQNYELTYVPGLLTIEARPTVDDLIPDEGDDNGGSSDYGSGDSSVDASTDLNETVVGNIYYCITPDAGGYDAEEGCLVINKAATTVSTELSAVDGQLPSASNGFRGLVFFVNAGRGKVKIKAETTGNLLLCVKIAGELVMSMAVEGKTTLTIPYDVSQPSEVLVYAGFAASSRSMASSTTEDALKIYSLEWESEPTAIGVDKIENGKLKIENYYDLSGRKVNGQLKKGVYIVGGRKRVVK